MSLNVKNIGIYHLGIINSYIYKKKNLAQTSHCFDHYDLTYLKISSLSMPVYLSQRTEQIWPSY